MPGNLNNTQFTLPGLGGMRQGQPTSPEKPVHPFVEHAQSKWSGPTPGQQVMGVHDLGGDGPWKATYEVDHTGMVQERANETKGKSTVQRVLHTGPERHLNDPSPAVSLYRTHGGAKADSILTKRRGEAVAAGHPDTPEGARAFLHSEKYSDAFIDQNIGESQKLQDHWASMPVHQIPSNAPVHTGQSVHETLDGGDTSRIPKIRGSLQNGHDIQKPAWMVKKAGRLYALDGHHRITAAREEGRESYPAHVWDMDAEKKARSSGMPARNAMAAMPKPKGL